MPIHLITKPGVRFDKDSLALSHLLGTLLLMPGDFEVVITAGSDGTHMTNSRHDKGEAIDIRSHNLAHPQRFRADYEKALGSKFRVLFESPGTPNEHLHAQVRKGQTT